MADVSELWYVRFPDGRVIRAKSTKSLRYHISTGRIPPDSRVRHSPAEEWTALEWTSEFVDILPKTHAPASMPPANFTAAPEAAATRPKIQEMKVLGLRGLVHELADALESTLHSSKLVPALGLGLLLGVGGAVYGALVVYLEPPWSWIGAALIGVCLLLAFCLVASLLTQMIFIELSRLRPARPKEVRAGLARHTLHLLLAYFLACGFVLLILLTLQRLPTWLLSSHAPRWRPVQPNTLLEGLLAPVVAVRQAWEVACWPVVVSMLLFGPIVVIEECSFARAIREWWGMLRRHLGRLLLYETMALLLGLLVAAPFLLPVIPRLISTWGETGLLGTVSSSTVALLGGLALTPFLAYLLVANVFIYLSLRYEFSQAK